MNELSISKQYPAEKYNLLGNTDVMVDVPDITCCADCAVRSRSKERGGLYPTEGKGCIYRQEGDYSPCNSKFICNYKEWAKKAGRWSWN